MTTRRDRITNVTLDDRSVTFRNPEITRERASAIADLLKSNHFELPGMPGPYAVHLAVVDNRVVLTLDNPEGDQHRLSVATAALRRVIKDYFLICESYYAAIAEGNHSKVEAIDMGRRGVHNEGAEQLQRLLKDRASMDMETARRIFTLICVLHLN